MASAAAAPTAPPPSEITSPAARVLRQELGPDVLGHDWDPARAVANLAAYEGLAGDALLDQGVVKEDGAAWVLLLDGDDALRLAVGTLTIDARRGRGRFARLPFDARVLVLLGLAPLAVALIVASVSRPPEMPKLHWLRR